MRIWSFDLGIQSLGYAVRGHGEDPNEFQDEQSLLIPEEVGSTDHARTQRRMWRTRQAHKAREAWLRKVFREAGLGDAVLEGRRVGKVDGRWRQTRAGDFRLGREFPPNEGEPTQDGALSHSQGAKTVYCGSLLRCLLIAAEYVFLKKLKDLRFKAGPVQRGFTT